MKFFNMSGRSLKKAKTDRFSKILMFMVILQFGIVDAMQETDPVQADYAATAPETSVILEIYLECLCKNSLIVKADKNRFDMYRQAFYDKEKPYYLEDWHACHNARIKNPKSFYEYIADYTYDNTLDFDSYFTDKSFFEEVLEKGNERDIVLLTRHGANLNKLVNNGTPLVYVLKSYKNFRIAHYLIDSGADVNGKSQCDHCWPLLVVACSRIKIIDKSVPDHAQLDEQTLNIAKKLIEKGARIDAKNLHGISALTFAVDQSDSKLVQLLLASDQINLQMLNQEFFPILFFDFIFYRKDYSKVSEVSDLIAQKKKELSQVSAEKNLSEDSTQLKMLEDTNLSMQKSKKLSLGKVEKLPITADEKWFEDEDK